MNSGVLGWPLDNGDGKEFDNGNKKMEEKRCAVDPWGFCGTHEQKLSKFQSKTFKSK